MHKGTFFEQNPDQELLWRPLPRLVTAIIAFDSGVNLDEPCKITVPDLEEGRRWVWTRRYTYT